MKAPATNAGCAPPQPKYFSLSNAYRSPFLARGTVAHYGGAVAFVTAWLDDEAVRTGWSGAQLSLF
jgi:hypothetical protein